MGVLQNQFNSAFTGLTFLAQQTPWWQAGARKQEATRGFKNIQKGYKAAGKAAQNPDASDAILREGRQKLQEYAKGHTADAPEIRAKVEDIKQKYKKQEMERNNVPQNPQQQDEDAMARLEAELSMDAAVSSVTQRQAEINIGKNNMKSFIEQIKAMREAGIIKSNRQEKSMLYKAGKLEDKK